MTIHLAGIPIRDQAVLELARLVDDPLLAEKLEAAHRSEVKILALEITETGDDPRRPRGPAHRSRRTPRCTAL